MDDKALYDLATATALLGLARNSHFVALLADHDDSAELLKTRLVDGQFDCAGQLRTVTIFSLRCVMPVVGRDWTLASWDSDLAALGNQIVAAKAEIEALGLADFAGSSNRAIHHKAGEAELTQSAEDYLIQFAIPNLWFHLSSAYAILRHAGLDIGKADFDGLHSYPQGFSFV